MAVRMTSSESAMKLRRILTTLAAVGVGAVLVTGCQGPPVGADAALSAASDAASTGDYVDPFAPVTINPSQGTASATVGASIVFEIPDADILTTIPSTADSEVLEITPAEEQGAIVFGAAGTALAPGTATITFTSTTGPTSEVVLTITE